MLANPKQGQTVQIWYGKKSRYSMPLHGAKGTVVIASKGKPRNHLVQVGAITVVVPCGNINRV